MSIEEFQQRWQAMKFPEMSDEEILGIIRAKWELRLRKITVREKWEMVGNTAFVIGLIIWWDMFSHWVTTLGAIWMIILLLDHYLGIYYLLLFGKKEQMKELLTRALHRINIISRLIRFIYLLIWLGMAVALGTQGYLGITNNFLWALLLFPLLYLANWWTVKQWNKKGEEIDWWLQLYI